MSNNYVFLLLLLINFKLSSNEKIVSEEKPKGVSIANNYFAINLLRELTDEKNNVLFSPFAITTVFNMLYFGAKGRTAEEIEDVFGLRLTNLTKAQIGDQYRQLMTDLFGTDSKSFDFFAANLLVSQSRNPILVEYENQTKEFFNSSIKTIDFLFKTNEAVDQINDWVRTSTRGKIEELLAEPLSPLSVLILLNAVYFKGQWRQQFLKWATKEEDFKGLNKAIKVSQMKLSQAFNYTTVGPLDRSQLIELPYGREQHISMYVLLPPEGSDVRALSARLSDGILEEAIANMTETTVRLVLPKFNISRHYDLKSVLQTLGITQTFTYKSDLSAIDGTNYLHVSNVYHKTVLEVDEEGNEGSVPIRAVGQTRGLFGRYRNVPTFRADHPFFFFIRHKPTGIILFAGLLNKP